jgi:hypothetical protein
LSKIEVNLKLKLFSILFRIMTIEISETELQQMIVKFKKEAYAGNAEYKTTPNKTKRFESQMNGWEFSDEYEGDAWFAGRETLSKILPLRTPTWSMNYYGRVMYEEIPKERVFAFLRESLKAVPTDLPFRGPKRFNHKDFPNLSYHNRLIDGKDVTYANGIETIWLRGYDIYKGRWSGGVIMKDIGDIVLI